MSEQHWRMKLATYSRVNCSNLPSLERKEFILDLLQYLFSDHVSDGTRLHMVCFVQEQVEAFVQDIDSAEQTVGSLLALFKSLSYQHCLLKCQIMVTITTIILNHMTPDVRWIMFEDFLHLLLDSVMEVKSGHPLVRKACCECLAEIERTHPGCLREHLYSLFAAGKDERSFSFQANLILVSKILANAIAEELEQKVRLKLTPAVSSPGAGKNDDYGKYILFLVEQSSRMSPTGLLQVMSNVLPGILQYPVPITALHGMGLYSTQAFDLLLLQFGLMLQNVCPLAFGDAYESRIVGKLLRLIAMPQLQAGERLLFIRWLQEHVLELPKGLIQSDAAALSVQILRPTVFDGLDVLRMKIESICYMCETIDITVEEPLSMIYVLSIKASASLIGKDTCTLFRLLYVIYSTSVDMRVKSSVFAYVEHLSCHLKFAPYIMDFLDYIGQDDSLECVALVKKLASNLLSTPFGDMISNIDLFLKMLGRVCIVKTIYPLVFVKKLKEICLIGPVQACSWITGNVLLSVCRSVILTHTKSDVLHEMADLLWIVSQSFVNKDISDRALYYYLLIGNISPKYFPHLLPSVAVSAAVVEGGKALGEISSALSQPMLPITMYKKQFLACRRVPSKFTKKQYFKCADDELLSAYKVFLQSAQMDKSLRHKCCVAYVDNVQDCPDQIFALSIKLKDSSFFAPVEELVIRYLSKDIAEAEASIELRFVPLQPKPEVFPMNCTFSDVTSKTWVLKMEPFQLKFEDLFLPLAWPYFQGCEYADKERHELFDQIWNEIVAHQTSSGNRESSTALSVRNLGSVTREELLRQMEDFVVYLSGSRMKVGMFIPPSNHLLFDIDFDCVTAVLVRIAIDDWKLLAHVDDYLDSFFSASQT